MTLVNNNTGAAPAYPTAAALPQLLPQSQQDWQNFLNAMQARFPQLPLIPLIDSSSTVNVVTLTSNSALCSSYTLGMNILFQPANTNTFVVNINVNGLGNQELVISGGGFPGAGTIVAGYIYSATYNGTAFVLQTNLGDGSGSGGGGVTSLTGTASQIDVSASTGAVTVSLDPNIQLGGSTFSGVPLAIVGHSTPEAPMLSMDSGNVAATIDLFLGRDALGTANSALVGPNLVFADDGGNTLIALQHSGGQFEIWSNPAGTWVQLAFWSVTRGLTLNAAASGQTLTVGPSPAAGELIATSAALTNGAGSSTGTLGNAPSVGNPTKWIKINDNGTVRSVPAW